MIVTMSDMQVDISFVAKDFGKINRNKAKVKVKQ